MSDLLTRLREYGCQLDAEARPLPTQPVRVTPRPSRRIRPWVIAATAAVLAVVLTGAVVWLVRGDDAGPGVADQVPDVPETWTTWTTADGVVGDCACSMTVAGDGAVWVAGFDGISRFDGVGWERMSLPQPLTGEGWPEVAAAPDGSVWVSGMAYIARYRDGTWDSIVEAGSHPDGDRLAFEGLLVDDAGRVWTSVEEQPGLIVDGTFTPADETVVGIPGYDGSWGIPWSVEPGGALWFFAAGPGGADLRVDGEEVTEHILQAAIVGYDPDGSLWMGGMYPLIRDDGESLTMFELGGVRATAFGADGTGWFLVHQVGEDAWIFGEEQWSDPGLYRLDDGEWYRITTEDWLPGYRLSVMLMTEDGALWISTADGTVTRYQPGTDPETGTPVDIESRPLTEDDLLPPDEYPPPTVPDEYPPPTEAP